MSLFSSKLVKLGALAITAISLSACEEIHRGIHAGEGLSVSGKEAISDYSNAKVGDVVSRTSVPYTPYMRKKGECGPDEHKHKSRKFCHGHLNGFITTSLPQYEFAAPVKAKKGHTHRHTHPHH